MLDLEFSPEQDMLRETVRKVCATSSPLSVVRELEDDPVGYSTDLWKQMAELDLIGLLLPEEHGGSGMGALEGVVLYEELGSRPRPHAAFRQRGAVRRGTGPAGIGRAAGAVAARQSPGATPSSPRRGSSPRTAAGPPGSRCGPSPTATATA